MEDPAWEKRLKYNRFPNTKHVRKKKKKCWFDVLKVLIEIVKFHGTQKLAFPGSPDTLYQKDDGNVLKLNELFEKFDPIMKSRKSVIWNSAHYLSKDSQNEALQILGDVIKEKSYHSFKILNIIIWSWIILLIAGKTERMSVIIRFSSFSKEKVEIKESFLGFVDFRFNRLRPVWNHKKNFGNVEYSNCRYERTRLWQQKSTGEKWFLKSMKFFVKLWKMRILLKKLNMKLEICTPN